MGVRNIRFSASTQNRRDDADRVYTRNDHLVDHSREIALGIAKQVAQMNRNALEVDTRLFHYYRRRTVGRVCSCCLAGEVAPDATCMVCYATGVVGGYDKYGTTSHTLDYTTPGLRLVNVLPIMGRRPIMFRLADEAKTGWIEADFDLRTNTGFVDAYKVTRSLRPGENDVVAEIRTTSGGPWLELTPESLTGFLVDPRVTIRVTMTRRNTDCRSPVFSHLYFRYGLLEKADTWLKGDIPQNTEGVNLQEFGFEEQFSAITVVFGDTVQNFTIDDFLYYAEKDRYWKITEVAPNYALGRTLETKLTCRWLQGFEIQRSFLV